MGQLSSSAALDRYDRRLFSRSDESFVNCFVSLPPSDEPAPLVFFCQSSGCASMFEERPYGGFLDRCGWVWEKSAYSSVVRLAFVEKRGVMLGSMRRDPGEASLPPEFLDHDRREERIEDVVMAIEELVKDPMVDVTRVALLGHGEGAAIAAGAALQLPCVTHLGYLSRGGDSRVRELITLKRMELSGALNENPGSEAEMDVFFHKVEAALNDPDRVDEFCLGYTTAHITSYWLCSPIDDLSRLKIPIFVAAGGDDSHVPVSSVDMIRMRFLMEGKGNLTYRIYPGLDHWFYKTSPLESADEDPFRFPFVFDEFCRFFLEGRQPPGSR